MANSYDVIIIGSGLGGLSAATTLSRRGLRILLLEQHTQPGGYATTFFRDRFEFEVSLHALSGIGTPANPGPLFVELDEMDVARRVAFIAMDDLYRSVGPDWDFVLPTGVAAYKDALISEFPKEAKGISKLIKQVLTIGYEVDLLRQGSHSTAPLPTLLRYPNLVHAAGVPLSRVLDRELKDPLAKLAIAQVWGYFALPPSRLSLLMFAVGLNMHLLYGSAALEGKSQSLSNAFVDVIREAGGEVSFSRGVTRITTDDAGRVNGVETTQGERITADTVIANVNPITTLTRLMDGSAVPADLLRRLRKMPPGLGAVNLYLGLSKPSSTLGITDYEVCINQHIDMDRQYQTCLDLVLPGNLTLCAYDLTNPVASPDGTGLVNITALSDGRLWTEMDPARYTDAKAQMADWILSSVARIYPRITNAVETVSVSTPVTNMRYTGNPGGAIYGFANTPSLNPGFRLENRSPVPGLWFAGAWTQPGGGYQATISSGINTARQIIEQKEAEGAILTAPVPSRRMLQEKPPGAVFRKLRGIGLVLKDGSQVKNTLKAKYRKETGAPAPCCRVLDTVGRFHADNLEVVLDQRWAETRDTVTLRFMPKVGALPPFVPGQYFSLQVRRNGRRARRAYSASSPPADRYHIEFTVKRQTEGDVSRYLTESLTRGDSVRLTGPFGDFSFNPLRDTSEIVAIAVGSGITPFMSMLAAFSRAGQAPLVTLLYGSRHDGDIIFFERLSRLANRHPWLTMIPILSAPSARWRGEKGRIDTAFLTKYLAPNTLRNKSFFLCAPRDLYQTMVPDLIQMGVPRRRIRLEAYGPPADVTRDAKWPKSVARQSAFKVQLLGMEEPIHALAGVPLLTSLEQAGVHPPAHCRAGICDACKVELVSGEVFTPKDGLGIQVGLSGKRIHSCMSYPLSDLSLVD